MVCAGRAMRVPVGSVWPVERVRGAVVRRRLLTLQDQYIVVYHFIGWTFEGRVEQWDGAEGGRSKIDAGQQASHFKRHRRKYNSNRSTY